MLPTQVLATIAYLCTLTIETEPPNYSGFTTVWKQTFSEKAGALSTANWNFALGDKNYNNEFQRYTSSADNVRTSGSGTLQIIPRQDRQAPNGWTSGRIESKYSLLPRAGKVTRVESSLRLAGNPRANKQGIWPAFWMLGESYRTGRAVWPACGEIDIMESVNGQPVGYGVLHCDKAPGGICNENNGIGSGTTLPDNQFHVWRVQFDLTGANINNQNVWSTLCQSPMYIILNVAIGGNWPGAPNSNTWPGTGAMMEVNYVAHYVSN